MLPLNITQDQWNYLSSYERIEFLDNIFYSVGSHIFWTAMNMMLFFNEFLRDMSYQELQTLYINIQRLSALKALI